MYTENEEENERRCGMKLHLLFILWKILVILQSGERCSKIEEDERTGGFLDMKTENAWKKYLSLIHISEPTRP